MLGIAKSCQLRQVTVVSVVIRSFRRQKSKQTEVDEAMRSSSKQSKNMKFKDAPIPIFHYAVNFIWCGQSGKFKAWFFFGTPEFIFWFVEIIQNLKIAFVRMDTLSPFHDSTIIVVTGSNTVAMYCGRLSFGCNCRKLWFPRSYVRLLVVDQCPISRPRLFP